MATKAVPPTAIEKKATQVAMPNPETRPQYTADGRRFPWLGAPIAVADPWDQFADAPPSDPWAQFKDEPKTEPDPRAALPPLPPGFTLDQPHQSTLPPLPNDFRLDARSAPARPQVSFEDLIPEPQQLASSAQGMFDDLIPPEPTVAQGAGFNGATKIQPSPSPSQRGVSLFPSGVGGATRDLAVGTRGVVKGLGDIVLAPFDLAAGAQNLVTSGINGVFRHAAAAGESGVAARGKRS